MLRTLTATRYVLPLREGGSVPAIVEAEDDGLYVLKFRGAAQGPKALIAELLGGEIGRVLGLPVPELVFLELDGALGRSEPHYEIQNLIKKSHGLNLGLDFLPGAASFTTLDLTRIAPHLASLIVWFDAYLSNVDRTARNPNLLFWHRNLYLIDHGAALYFQHATSDFQTRSGDPFRSIKDHVLLPMAAELMDVSQEAQTLLTAEKLAAIVQEIPTDWLDQPEQRADYLAYLQARLNSADNFVQEAQHARTQLV
jgi:hypothetical protein